MTIQTLLALPWEEGLLRAQHILTLAFLAIAAAGAAFAAACVAAESARAELARFAAWCGRTPKTVVLAVLLGVALATRVGGSKGTLGNLPSQSASQSESSSLTLLSASGASQLSAVSATPSYLMPSSPDGFTPPERYTNTLSQAQYDAGFALTFATNTAHDFEVPANAAATDYAPAHGVSDEAWWIPLSAGFNAGGLEDLSRRVTSVCAAPSGMILLDALPGRPAPSAPVFAGSETNRLLSVLQTPSGLLPPEGRLWAADAANGAALITWRNLMLGRRAEARADLQCELFPNGDFAYYIRPHADGGFASVTNWLIAAQDGGGGETRAFAANAPLSSAVPTNGATLELRWTAFGRLDPSVPDTDGDGLTDWEELMVYRTSVRNRDTDGDGLTDGEEVLAYGTDPLRADSLGDGTNDFWRVVGAASLSGAPWMEAAGGEGLLTLETRLDGAESGLAALRIGDVIVPVPPGTTLVSRVAFPCNENVPFALIFAPGSESASASVTATDSDRPVVFNDPESVFALPAAPAAPGLQAMSASAAAPGGLRGSLCGVLYDLSPTLLCPHTGNTTLTISVVGAAPQDSGIAAIGFGPVTGSHPPTRQVTSDDVRAAANAQGATSVGSHTVRCPVEVSVAVRSGYRVLNPDVTNGVPAHRCVFEGADPPDDNVRHTCLCCGDDSLCPCRCVSTSLCACVTCGHPYETGSPTNSAGEPMGVHSRAHRLLLAGGEPDQVGARPQSPDGTSANGKCPFCGCTQSGSPAASLPALAWRRTGGLASSPSSLATSGVFTVTGVSPSGRAGDGVFTWRAGSVYSRGRYTVVSLGAAFAYAASGTAPIVQAGHTNALLVLTAVPADGEGTLTFAYDAGDTAFVLNRTTGAYDPLPNGTAVPASDWLGTYAPTNTFEADLRYVASEAGDHAFAATYEQQGCTPTSVSTNYAFEAFDLTVDVRSGKLGVSPNPPPFSGRSEHVFRPDSSPDVDQHAVVLYKDVVDANFAVADFDVALSLGVSPEDALPASATVRWEKLDGPDSGGLVSDGSAAAVYRNPKKGGVYRFRATISDGGHDLGSCDANLVLPLAGAEMDAAVKADLAKADAFAAAVTSRYSPRQLQYRKNWRRWFWDQHAGDYTGRPDNAGTPTVWFYNQVNDASGFGAVCTWKGRPVRLTKPSNFILGYAMQQIGASRAKAQSGTLSLRNILDWNFTDSASVGAGWDVAADGEYDTTVSALADYIWAHEAEDDKSRKVWPNPCAPDNYKGSSSNIVFDYNEGYGAPGFLFKTR